MRDIKFRVWDEETKGMHVVRGLPFYEENGTHMTPYTFDPKLLMQFTGLKDKNGKPIYEDDIVAFTDDKLKNRSLDHGGPKKNRVVTWRKNGYNLTRIGKDGTAHGVEVIGNIYESPELLESTS